MVEWLWGVFHLARPFPVRSMAVTVQNSLAGEEIDVEKQLGNTSHYSVSSCGSDIVLAYYRRSLPASKASVEYPPRLLSLFDRSSASS